MKPVILDSGKIIMNCILPGYVESSLKKHGCAEMKQKQKKMWAVTRRT